MDSHKSHIGDMVPIEPDIPESLQARLEEYNANFERLGAVLGDQSLTEAAATRAVRERDTRDVLSDAQPFAVQAMINLLKADSESVRYNAAKTILEWNIGKDPAFKAEDPAMDLIDRLKSDPVTADSSEGSTSNVEEAKDGD